MEGLELTEIARSNITAQDDDSGEVVQSRRKRLRKVCNYNRGEGAILSCARESVSGLSCGKVAPTCLIDVAGRLRWKTGASPGMPSAGVAD